MSKVTYKPIDFATLAPSGELPSQELGPRQLAWVEALESGKYQQGEGALRDEQGRYCCLGVLCEIEGLPYTEASEVVSPYFQFGEYKCNGFLPTGYGREIGLEGESGELKYDYVVPRYKTEPSYNADGSENLAPARTSTYTNLAELNDDAGATFKDIAALIRKHPANFFSKVV